MGRGAWRITGTRDLKREPKNPKNPTIPKYSKKLKNPKNPEIPQKENPIKPKNPKILKENPLTPAFNGQPREELPLPTQPPFTAFVGNLSFETDEESIKGFFGDSIAVRLMKDPQGAPKGFGYVEFSSQDSLKSALGKNSTQLGGRTVRVTVAEARKSF